MADEPVVGAAAEEKKAPTVEELQAQIAERDRLLVERDSKIAVFDKTLAALGTREPEHPAPTTVAPPAAAEAAMIREIAQETGLDEETVRSHIPLYRAFLRREAQPLVTILGGMAERIDTLDAELTVEDWKELRDEAKRLQKTYREQKGVHLSARDAADLARARLGPELLAKRERDKAAQDQERTIHAHNASGSTTVQKPGPSPEKQVRALTRADLDRMTPEQRLAALEAAGAADTPF